MRQSDILDFHSLGWVKLHLTEESWDFGHDQEEIIEAVCKTYDKFWRYPPRKNRTAWFKRYLGKK